LRRNGRLADSQSELLGFTLFHGGNKALLSLLPVDDGPHLLKVARARVLVVEVVSVLPDVDVDDRHQVGAHIGDEVLVGGSAERE